MFGYDAITVLPILLLLTAFGGIIAIAITAYIEVISKNCKICGIEFMCHSDLREHMLDHDKTRGTKRFVSKKRFRKAA